jgi:hypothetical protein
MKFVPILAIILAFIYFIYPRLENYFRKRPKLIVEIEPNKGITSQQNLKGYSDKNPPISEDPDEMWYIYEFEWLFNLIIRNNSEITAYDIKMLQKNDAPKIEFQKTINFQKAMKAHEEIELPFKISTIIECQGKEREFLFDNQAGIFKTLKILLEYKNPQNREFYSTFSFKEKKTNLNRIQSYEKNYWH